jgi:hypothetical protein
MNSHLDGLIEMVIDQIKEDFVTEDLAPLHELLAKVPVKYLTGFLSEPVEGKSY